MLAKQLFYGSVCATIATAVSIGIAILLNCSLAIIVRDIVIYSLSMPIAIYLLEGIWHRSFMVLRFHLGTFLWVLACAIGAPFFDFGLSSTLESVLASGTVYSTAFGAGMVGGLYGLTVFGAEAFRRPPIEMPQNRVRGDGKYCDQASSSVKASN